MAQAILNTIIVVPILDEKKLHMKIQTRELEKIFERIIAKLDSEGVDQIELKQDFYWFLSNKDSYKANFEVDKPMLGSFKEDWANLKLIAEDKQIVTYVDLERMSFILKAIAEELNPEE